MGSLGRSTLAGRSIGHRCARSPSVTKSHAIAKGPNAPDLELCVVNGAAKDHGKRFLASKTCSDVYAGDFKDTSSGYISIDGVDLRPKSRGTIKLGGDTIFDRPLIDPRALSEPEDLDALVVAAKKAKQVMETPPYSHHITSWFQAPKDDSEESWREFVTQNVETLYHPIGSAVMGRLEDKAVVDSK